MKIVFCGPPHSGKSVFIANLIDRLPSDDYTIIRACPDGEGTWSNNKNQDETSIVRKKGKVTKSFIDDSCKAIDNQTNKIILVDVGGLMSKENEQIFKHCDDFVVLSNDENKKREWVEFGEKLGLKCIACLDSSLDGKEEIYAKSPILQGRIVGLERGKRLTKSTVMNAIASEIIKRSQYSELSKNADAKENKINNTIDDTKLGFKLGYGKEIYTDDGIPIRKVKWEESAIPQIYQEIKKTIDPEKPVNISGIRANFLLVAVCKAARENGAKDIQSYDIRLKQYIPIKKLQQKRGIKKAEDLNYTVIEGKDNIFMDVDITKEKYNLDSYQKCVIPKLNKEKNLYLSGRIPLWLLASISSSYDNKSIYTFQPGNGFTCISSSNEKELGNIVDGIDGININKYFEDKKEKQNQKNLPMKMKKQEKFSILKNLFEKYKEKIKNTKYIDNSIKAHTIKSVTKTQKEKEKLRASIENEMMMQTKRSQGKEEQNIAINYEQTQKEIGD